MDHYEKTMKRILPLPLDAVSIHFDKEKIRTEAEIWCKPFACTVQGCSEPRIRNDTEKLRCQEAPAFLHKCIQTMSLHLEELIDQKRKLH